MYEYLNVWTELFISYIRGNDIRPKLLCIKIQIGERNEKKWFLAVGKKFGSYTCLNFKNWKFLLRNLVLEGVVEGCSQPPKVLNFLCCWCHPLNHFNHQHATRLENISLCAFILHVVILVLTLRMVRSMIFSWSLHNSCYSSYRQRLVCLQLCSYSIYFIHVVWLVCIESLR